MIKPRTITCPSCGKDTVYSPENPWRPFCSESCRTIDLGAWASDQYSIADKEEVDTDTSSEEPLDTTLRH